MFGGMYFGEAYFGAQVTQITLVVPPVLQGHLTAIRSLLEAAVVAADPSISAVWENTEFLPTAGQAYQIGHLLFAAPDNLVLGNAWCEQGYMQIRLMHPQAQGSGAGATKAEALRSAFYRGRMLVGTDLIVTINKTPDIGEPAIEEDRYATIVKIRFFVNGLT